MKEAAQSYVLASGELGFRPRVQALPLLQHRHLACQGTVPSARSDMIADRMRPCS